MNGSMDVIAFGDECVLRCRRRKTDGGVPSTPPSVAARWGIRAVMTRREPESSPVVTEREPETLRVAGRTRLRELRMEL